MELRRQQSAADNMAAMREMKERFDMLSREHPEEGELLEPLREEVQQLLRADYPREVVIGALDDFRYILRDGERDDLEDDVADVMNAMTGWSSSHVRL